MMEVRQKKAVERPDLAGLGHAVADYAPLPMALVEGAGDILRYVNPAFCRLLETSAEELVGKSFCEAIPDGAECAKLLARAFQGGKPESYRQREDSVGWSYTMWPVLSGEQSGGVMIQVTESAKLQREIVAM